MSLHEQYIFPLQPHLPPPDWPALDALLLEKGFVISPRGTDVPAWALNELRHRLCQALDCQLVWREGAQTTGDVLRDYVGAGTLPEGLPIRDDMTMAETLQLLARHDICPLIKEESDHCTWHSPAYKLGPAAVALLSEEGARYYEEAPGRFHLTLLAYDGPHPSVCVGENLEPPCLPGSDEPLAALPPFESHVDFIGAAFENPGAQWYCEQTGQNYHLLDLDWQYSLGFGFRMIRLQGMDQDSTMRLAQAIGELVGQPMGCSHLHL